MKSISSTFVLSLLCSALLAQGPNGAPQQEGTIKETVKIPTGFFDTQLKLINERKAAWLAKAEAARPELFHRKVNPQVVVNVVSNSACFQGWGIGETKPLSSVFNRIVPQGESFVLDFGEHLTGYVTLNLISFANPVDAPVRLKLKFGETLSEVAEDYDPYKGSLTRSWLQDETMNIDVVPQEYKLPRRYAFRYLKVEVIACSGYGSFGFSEITADAVTSADESRLAPLDVGSDLEVQLDRVSCVTLRDCMQSVFEDGPKRDRRLWLGDLRLQALVNYETYRNYDAVKRSLYILAGTATEHGLGSTCAYEKPVPMHGGTSILDYTALLAPTVLEYLEASGDRETALDLWPLVVKHLDFTLEPVNKEGLFVNNGNWWCFIDWNEKLQRDAPEQGVIICGAKATLDLARKLGREQDVEFLPAVITLMETAARKNLWDEKQGMFVSGPDKQISWASQAWMVLAGVASREQAQRALTNVLKFDGALKPVTPYMHHYFVEALYAAGMEDNAQKHIHSYWGGMIKLGADTFWEVYVPEDQWCSPYGCHLINSSCHAWSCTPAYFLRRR